MSEGLDGIAIVGMAGRFPGADSIDELWSNLKGGVDCVSTIPDEVVLASGIEARELSDPRYVPRAGILRDADRFDAQFFDVTRRDAQLMDPQQRHLLECSWEALESAGYGATGNPRNVGVYAGTGFNTYLLRQLAPDFATAAYLDQYRAFIANDKDFAATRVAHALNLTGPAMSIQTACSSSLVAVCTAALHLMTYQCDMALAGGVSIRAREAGYRFAEGGILSPDGFCRAFDADAAGTVPGSGLGIVVLKRLEDAVADRDFIWAVIKGFALNNDGAEKATFTAPSEERQAEVIGRALAMAGVDARSVGYVEAHGTGTSIGDPIELAALTRAFRASMDEHGHEGRQDRGFCAIGSVKTNFGHLDVAAGVAGLIKTALSVRFGVIAPSLHFKRPNPLIDFASSPFFVNTEARAWKAEGPRRAGVSSFGIGGTNAHVVLEQAPAMAPSSAAPRWVLLPLSARTPAALERLTARLAAYLKDTPAVNLGDVAYTLQVGREPLTHRRAILCRTTEEAIGFLGGQSSPQTFTDPAAQRLAELGRTWLAGSQVDWSALSSDERRSRVPLPSYPFEHERFWFAPSAPSRASGPASESGITAANGEPATSAEPALFLEQLRALSPEARLSFVEHRVRAEVARVIGVPADEVPFHKPLTALGMDSLAAVELRNALSRQLHLKLPGGLLFDQPDLTAITQSLSQILARSATSARDVSAPGPGVATGLQRMHPEPTSPPIFFVGGAVVGDDLYLRDLANALGPLQPCYALIYPGMGSGEEPLEDIGSLAEYFLSQIARFHGDAPCTLAGHSMGGVVALEMALHLAQNGQSVVELIIIDAPLLACDADLERGHALWRTDSIRDYLSRAKALGWLPEDMIAGVEQRASSESRWELLDQMWRKNIAALRSYRPSRPYHGEVTFITPSNEQEGLLSLGIENWKKFCPHIKIIRTSGSHFTIVRDPHAKTTARVIRRLLDTPDARDP